jgi:hypothetical protein
MKAVMLAAGIGAGFGNSRTLNLTNIFLRFGGRSLRHRSIDRLRRSSIEERALGTGFKPGGIEIDFSVDVESANAECLPRLNTSTRHASRNAVTDSPTGRMSNNERC